MSYAYATPQISPLFEKEGLGEILKGLTTLYTERGILSVIESVKKIIQCETQ